MLCTCFNGSYGWQLISSVAINSMNKLHSTYEGQKAWMVNQGLVVGHRSKEVSEYRLSVPDSIGFSGDDNLSCIRLMCIVGPYKSV
jgi:hypothetical protein